MFPYLFLTVFLGIVLLATIRETLNGGWNFGIFHLALFIGFLLSGRKVFDFISFFLRARRQGWVLGFPTFLFRASEIAGRESVFIPPRSEFEASPAFDSKRDEFTNLATAVGYAVGWDPETAARRTPVEVFSSAHWEIVQVVKGLLAEEGFTVIDEDDSAGGVYRVKWASRVCVPAEQAEAARECIRHHADDIPADESTSPES